MLGHLARAARTARTNVLRTPAVRQVAPVRQNHALISRPVPAGVPAGKEHLWIDPANRAPMPTTDGVEKVFCQIIGGTLTFWILWRFKHDWKTLFVRIY